MCSTWDFHAIQQSITHWIRPGSLDFDQCILSCMPVVYDLVGSRWLSHNEPPNIAFRICPHRRHPNWVFRGSIHCLHDPCSNACARLLRGERHSQGRCGSLLLHRTGLPQSIEVSPLDCSSPSVKPLSPMASGHCNENHWRLKPANTSSLLSTLRTVT